jgi:hypothetical protein
MNWFWQKQTPPKAMEKASPPAMEPVREPAMEVVRRVEITVEEHWVSGVVPRPTASERQAPPDREQRIVRSLELPPGTEGDRGVTGGNHAGN